MSVAKVQRRTAAVGGVGNGGSRFQHDHEAPVRVTELADVVRIVDGGLGDCDNNSSSITGRLDVPSLRAARMACKAFYEHTNDSVHSLNIGTDSGLNYGRMLGKYKALSELQWSGYMSLGARTALRRALCDNSVKRVTIDDGHHLQAARILGGSAKGLTSLTIHAQASQTGFNAVPLPGELVVAIADMVHLRRLELLQQCRAADVADLHDNRVGGVAQVTTAATAVQSFAMGPALAQLTQLKTLKLHADILDSHAAGFGQGLAQLTRLTELHLATRREAGAWKALAMASASLGALAVLTVEAHNCTPFEVAPEMLMMPKLGALTLHTMNGANQQQLAQALLKLAPSLGELTLTHVENTIDEAVRQALPQLGALVKLNLNSAIEDSSASTEFYHLFTQLTSIQKLRMSNNDTYYTFEHHYYGLADMRSLRTLEIQEPHLSIEHAINLPMVLPDSLEELIVITDAQHTDVTLATLCMSVLKRQANTPWTFTLIMDKHDNTVRELEGVWSELCDDQSPTLILHNCNKKLDAAPYTSITSPTV